MTREGLLDVDNSKTLPRSLKRQKTFGHDPKEALRHDAYTIAWICALSIERAAACAMLDDVHGDLPRDAHDINSYTLGSIEGHNIVIACLPEAQYGTINAAAVATNLTRTFPSIRIGLMVGVGGGVPSRADIRLGDVVVGTRVMQYDLGKVTAGGELQRTAISRLPHQSLCTLVSTLRSKHELDPSRIPSILQGKIDRYVEYRRPEMPDRLFQATYDHDSANITCEQCDDSRMVPRSTRPSKNPVIHYGAIASGNQVMKHAVTRDTVGRKLDVICFEMEAAGLMGVLPCLPIRGICDYSDSHKSKEWQRYAAATSAAYTRELLEVLAAVQGPKHEYVPASGSQEELYNRRRLLLESLRFDQMGTRMTNIKAAHAKSCEWFLQLPEYQGWLHSRDKKQHQGFLWIKGKPGAGKSTIMKFIYLKAKREKQAKDCLITSFFFNGRGEKLEKSILGLYRSLLLQLLEGYPDLQDVLNDTDLVPQSQKDCPSVNVLKNLFRSSVARLGKRSLTCFIDALDECDEQQVTDMVQYFEEVAEFCTDNSLELRICFSCRYYPYINIQWGMQITLEDQRGHARDLESYFRSRIRVKDASIVEELRPQILEKAAGVFLWVVLVVDILNRENNQGRLALKKRLAELPNGLSELFRDILRRDSDNMEQMLPSVLWILCAKRPLSPEEYHHALWSGLVLKGLADPELPDITAMDYKDCINSCVVTSSKGLAEITRGKQTTVSNHEAVQFIHQSVRDFLVHDGGLQELWPDVGYNWDSLSHEKLKRCCYRYMDNASTSVPVHLTGLPYGTNSTRYPLLKYASQHILYHANIAADTVPQDGFLASFSFPNWISIINHFEKFHGRQYSSLASPVYILADRGHAALISTALHNGSRPDVEGERYEYPLFAAMANGHKNAAMALLGCSGRDRSEILRSLKFGHDFLLYKNRNPLTWAAQEGGISLVRFLLDKGAAIEGCDMEDRTPLMRASSSGRYKTVELLIERGADVDATGWSPDAKTPLCMASESGHYEVARLLIDNGADINAQNSSYSPIQQATKRRHEAVLRLLVEKGAEVNHRLRQVRGFLFEDHLHPIPLHEAITRKWEAVSLLLIEKGAQVNSISVYGNSPLTLALEHQLKTVAMILIDRGANVNVCDNLVMLLVEKDANVNSVDNNNESPLHMASRQGYKEVIEILVAHGAT